MTPEDPVRRELWEAMMTHEGDEHVFEIEREPERGLSFSSDALDLLTDSLVVWIGTRIMRRWESTNEPPSRLYVELRVVVS